MGRPMIPSPMNPIGPCMTSVSSQSLAGDLEAGLPRPRRGVERVDYRSGASRVKGRSPARGRRYRRRAIRANVGAVRLRLDRVVPWRPDRLAIDPWTVLRLARYRRRDEAPAAVWEATRAMAARAGELAAPDRPAPAAPRRRGRLGPGLPRPGAVVLGPRGRAPSRGRAAGGRVRPDARAGARGRGDRPRRAAGAPRGLPPRPRGLGGDRGGGAGAPAGPDRGAAASPRVPPARPRPPRLAARRAARPRGALRGRATRPCGSPSTASSSPSSRSAASSRSATRSNRGQSPDFQRLWLSDRAAGQGEPVQTSKRLTPLRR